MKLRSFKTLTRLSALALGLLTLPLSVSAESSSSQSHQQIYTAIEAFVRDYHRQEEKVELELGKLDSRLNLQNCDQYLSINWSNSAKTTGRTTVLIHCTDGKKWSLHLPVNIGIYKSVIVANAQLQRHQEITEQDLAVKTENISLQQSGYFTDKSALIGYQAKLPISQGSLISPSMLSQIKLVKRGQQVTVVAIKNGISVKAAGTALTDGRQGELIQIRNAASKKIVEGVVTDRGIIKIQL